MQKHILRRIKIAPRGDMQQATPAGFCFLCGGEIYDFDSAYLIDGQTLCRGCLAYYAEKHFADRSFTGEKIREMTKTGESE